MAQIGVTAQAVPTIKIMCDRAEVALDSFTRALIGRHSSPSEGMDVIRRTFDNMINTFEEEGEDSVHLPAKGKTRPSCGGKSSCDDGPYTESYTLAQSGKSSSFTGSGCRPRKISSPRKEKIFVASQRPRKGSPSGWEHSWDPSLWILNLSRDMHCSAATGCRFRTSPVSYVAHVSLDS
jgi:hypothetical protein